MKPILGYDIEKAGRIEKAGSASQSQRMHGAGYVGAIVGQVGQVRRVGGLRRLGGLGLGSIFFWDLVGN